MKKTLLVLAAFALAVFAGAGKWSKKKGGDSVRAGEKELALMRAAEINDVAEVWRFIKARANVNAKNYPDDMTALMYAAWNNSADVAEILIAVGADIEAKTDYSGQTPLVFAARKNAAEVAKLLVEAGADVDARTDSGKTALMYAVFGECCGSGDVAHKSGIGRERER